jgi:FkbM family methyltransferase
MFKRLIRGDDAWTRPRDVSVFKRLLGDAPVQILDVGARGGLHQRWTPFADVLDAVGFEPDPDEFRRLSSAPPSGGRRRFLPYALGGAHERLNFHVCTSPGCSSLYPPNDEFVARFSDDIRKRMSLKSIEQFDVVPLDEVSVREKLRPDCLKVDVQGAELDVLRGGTTVLKNLKLIELEVEFNYQYKGQALFSEIDLFLRKHGYALLGLRRSFWRHRESVDRGKSAGGGHLVHGDVLYYNAAGLDAVKPLTMRDLTAWLLLLGAYRQIDFVMHQLETHPASRGLSDVDRRLIQQALIVPPTTTRRLLRTLLAPIVNDVGQVEMRQWVDSLRTTPAEDWHDPDFF